MVPNERLAVMLPEPASFSVQLKAVLQDSEITVTRFRLDSEIERLQSKSSESGPERQGRLIASIQDGLRGFKLFESHGAQEK